LKSNKIKLEIATKEKASLTATRRKQRRHTIFHKKQWWRKHNI